MRMRRKKNLDTRLEQVAELNMLTPAEHKGNWRALFGADENAQLHLEIGCGKGDFIVGNALKNPDICYVAVEREPNVILLAMEKALPLELKNLYFIPRSAISAA